MFSPFLRVRGLISRGALHEVCYMSSRGEIASMEIAVGARSPMAPTAATPYKDTAVAKLAPALVTYCKVTGGSVLATPPSIARGARHSRSTRPFYLLKAETTVQMANPHAIIFLARPAL